MFGGAGLKRMENTPCDSKHDCVIVVRYVDDLLIFAKPDTDVARLKSKIAKNLIMKELEYRCRSSVLKFFWYE